MRAAMERREASGSSQGPARPGTPPPSSELGPGSSAWQAGRSQCRPRRFRKPPAPPGAPFPSFEGETENGRRARPGPENQTHGTAERWLTIWRDGTAMSMRSINTSSKKQHRRRKRLFLRALDVGAVFRHHHDAGADTDERRHVGAHAVRTASRACTTTRRSGPWSTGSVSVTSRTTFCGSWIATALPRGH